MFLISFNRLLSLEHHIPWYRGLVRSWYVLQFGNFCVVYLAIWIQCCPFRFPWLISVYNVVTLHSVMGLSFLLLVLLLHWLVLVFPVIYFFFSVLFCFEKFLFIKCFASLDLLFPVCFMRISGYLFINRHQNQGDSWFGNWVDWCSLLIYLLQNMRVGQGVFSLLMFSFE